jgi:hypothetical protein
MNVKHVENPGDPAPGTQFVPIAMPCMCWHSWGTDPFDLDLRSQSTQMIARGEAMMAAGKALRAAADRESKQEGQ